MALFKKETPEEKAERELVASNVRNKTLIAAFIAGFAVFLFGVFASGGVGGFIGGMLGGAAVFFFALFGGAVFFSGQEKEQSRRRVAERAEAKRLSLQQAEQEERQRIEQQDWERKEVMRKTDERENAIMTEKMRRDNREYLLKKLANTNTYIDLYDSANPDTSARVRQGISRELTDILVKHSRPELASMVKQEPDIRGMLIALSENLRVKRINSAEAAQILAVLGTEAP